MSTDHDTGDAPDDATAEQVRAVRWKMLCSVHSTARERRAALERWHRKWIIRLQDRHPSWPLNEILEMLLLTEGSAKEVDEQLARWKAQTNHLLPGLNTNGLRDYQQFLSILHAQHQLRVSHGLRDESAEDQRRREHREGNEAWKRTFKIPGR